MSTLIQRWQDWLTGERGLSPLTVESYLHTVSFFQEWLQEIRPEHSSAHPVKLCAVTRQDVQQFLVRLQKSNASRSTRFHRLCALRSFYRFLVGEEVISFSPARGLKVRLSHRLPEWRTEAEMKELLRAADLADDSPLAPRNALLLHLLYGSGLRAGEVVSIRRAHLASDLSSVKVMGKGSIERIAPISIRAQVLLRSYLDSPNAPRGKWLFPRYSRAFGKSPLKQQKADEHITRQYLWKIVKKAAEAVGIKAHPHTLRHSAAAAMTINGADIAIVQQYLGHASPETTLIYAHVDTASLRRCYEQFHPRAVSRKEVECDDLRTDRQLHSRIAG
jgi:site-specific recombinase XerD